MNPHEIFLQMAPELASRLFSELFEKEKGLYKASIDTLAKQRKLRPVFVERKPRAERHNWMRDTLARKQNDAVAAHLLQIWLVNCHSEVLCDFLDALGIAHDENGTLEQLPPAPPKESLQSAVDTLLLKHDAGVVSVYLHAFQALDDAGGWSTLGEVLATDTRLNLAAPAPTPAG